MKSESDFWVHFIFYALFALVALGLVYAQAWNESATYNRLTGKNTTWWDALWVELRVADGVQ